MVVILIISHNTQLVYDQDFYWKRVRLKLCSGMQPLMGSSNRAGTTPSNL